MIYKQELENLMDMALIDGVLSEKEKQILFKKAETFGVDLDEFEMVLNAKLFEKQKNNNSENKHTASPISDKLGDVKKCPACGAITQSFVTKCAECDNEFRNIKASVNITKFFDKLDDLESHRKEITYENNNKDSDISFVTLLKWVYFWPFFLARKIISLIFSKRKPTVWSTTDMRKEEMIMNFPVPNSREDIIEFLTLSVSKIQDINKWKRSNEEIRNISKWNSIWKKKAEQVYFKAKLSMKDDHETIESIEQMLVESGIIKSRK
jgi:hypothetical protein